MRDLLDEILQRTGKQYISDLNNKINTETVKIAIKKIDVDLYDMKQWKSAIQYLSGMEYSPETLEDVKRYLDNL